MKARRCDLCPNPSPLATVMVKRTFGNEKITHFYCRDHAARTVLLQRSTGAEVKTYPLPKR